MGDYFDRQRNPLDLYEWAELMREDRSIAVTVIGDFTISTVWLGLNHAYFGGPPLIFETMVFAKDTDHEFDREMERYTTEEQALKGHEEMIKLVTSKVVW